MHTNTNLDFWIYHLLHTNAMYISHCTYPGVVLTKVIRSSSNLGLPVIEVKIGCPAGLSLGLPVHGEPGVVEVLTRVGCGAGWG